MDVLVITVNKDGTITRRVEQREGDFPMGGEDEREQLRHEDSQRPFYPNEYEY